MFTFIAREDMFELRKVYLQLEVK